MRLWVIRWIAGHKKWAGVYDMSYGHVVRAETESAARKLASRCFGDEGREVWLDPTATTCEELLADGEPTVILTDFLSG